MGRTLTEAGVNDQMRMLYSKYDMRMDRAQWLLPTGRTRPEEAHPMLNAQIRERVLDPEDTELVSGPEAKTSVTISQAPTIWQGAASAPALAPPSNKHIDRWHACGHVLGAPTPARSNKCLWDPSTQNVGGYRRCRRCLLQIRHEYNSNVHITMKYKRRPQPGRKRRSEQSTMRVVMQKALTYEADPVTLSSWRERWGGGASKTARPY